MMIYRVCSFVAPKFSRGSFSSAKKKKKDKLLCSLACLFLVVLCTHNKALSSEEFVLDVLSLPWQRLSTPFTPQMLLETSPHPTSKTSQKDFTLPSDSSRFPPNHPLAPPLHATLKKHLIAPRRGRWYSVDLTPGVESDVKFAMAAPTAAQSNYCM